VATFWGELSMITAPAASAVTSLFGPKATPYGADSAYFLCLPDGVYAFDFARHTIHPLFTPARGPDRPGGLPVERRQAKVVAGCRTHR
jgi:hypothetical protein